MVRNGIQVAQQCDDRNKASNKFSLQFQNLQRSPMWVGGRAKETHGQPFVTGIFICIFEQNEKWLKLYSTQVALIGTLITDQILKKSFIWILIFTKSGNVFLAHLNT